MYDQNYRECLKTGEWYIHFAKAEGQARVHKFVISNNKFVTTCTENKSTWSWACNQLKASDLLTCNLDRSTSEPAIRSCDTDQRVPCFWQLSIDHHMDVHYQVVSSHTSQMCEISHWLPSFTDGRTVTWLPKFFGWINNQIYLAVVLRSAAL